MQSEYDERGLFVVADEFVAHDRRVGSPNSFVGFQIIGAEQADFLADVGCAEAVGDRFNSVEVVVGQQVVVASKHENDLRPTSIFGKRLAEKFAAPHARRLGRQVVEIAVECNVVPVRRREPQHDRRDDPSGQHPNVITGDKASESKIHRSHRAIGRAVRWTVRPLMK